MRKRGRRCCSSVPATGRTRREYHRHIGDFTLFWTGVYPEMLRRLQSLLSKDRFVDYCEQGKRSYYIASTFAGKFQGGNRLVFGLETPFTEPHDFLFNEYHPKGTRNRADIDDPKLNAMIEQQMKTLDRADRKKQIYDIQRYLADQMYYPPGATSVRVAGLQPYVKDFFPRSDFGFGAELAPKLWIDK